MGILDGLKKMFSVDSLITSKVNINKGVQVSGSQSTNININNGNTTYNTTYNDYTEEKNTEDVELEGFEIDILNKWANGSSQAFSRVDYAKYVLFILGSDCKRRVDRYNGELAMFTQSLEKMEKAGYIEKDDSIKSDHKWYKLTGKAIVKFRREQ